MLSVIFSPVIPIFHKYHSDMQFGFALGLAGCVTYWKELMSFSYAHMNLSWMLLVVVASYVIFQPLLADILEWCLDLFMFLFNMITMITIDVCLLLFLLSGIHSAQTWANW